MDNSKKNKAKAENQKATAVGKTKETAKTGKPATPVPVKVPPLFRRIDWIALGVAFLAVWVVYLWTLAPDLTLEDSGELCTGSYYAGIPHPPGYPFWAIYSWFWTVIVPFGTVAWRVEVGESFAAAMGCGMLAMMVSRGSSMLIEGIEELKSISKQWESAICLVSGIVSGILLGVGAFMWKESVVINRISLFGVPWLIATLLCLMRWAYAPQQRRYLYLAMLLYGWCATIHQSLLLSAPGVEVLIALVLPRLGRDLFLCNSLIYLVILYFRQVGDIPAINAMTHTERIIVNAVGIGSICAAGWLITKTQKAFTEWKSILLMGAAWVFGVMVYLYEPISCMTDPPMQWGYPRTVEGFFHALSRGQYGVGEGTDIFQDPSRFGFQLYYLAEGLSQSFSWAYLFVGLIPFFFLLKMHKRERNWIIGLTSIYFCIAVELVIMLNVGPDRSTSELNKVFFTASHAVFAMMIGYGLTILSAYVATHYEKIRKWCFVGGGLFLLLAFYGLVNAIGKLYFGPAGQMKVSWLPFSNWGGWGFLAIGPDGQFTFSQIFHWIARAFSKYQYGLPVYANLMLLSLPVIFIIALLVYRKRGPVLILLAMFAVTPFASGLEHWYKCEQRNHWFGYWFGHDMFTPPFKDPATGKLSYDKQRRDELMKDPDKARLMYPEMARNAIIFGGTDPGRFCPTYMIFCDSFIPHRCQPEQDRHFDRRDCYLITQNALADGTYLDYLRAQYNRSMQHDPPFFSRLFRYLAVLAGIGNKNNVVLDGIDSGSGDSGNAVVEGICKMLHWTLDVPFTKWGKFVEDYRRKEGVYPPNEIYIPTPEDSQACFAEYAREKRLTSTDGRIQISGQVDVMNINGLLCKVIFDHNPTNEFYVEESFPLAWMYPYETPFGIIMKINRQPQMQMTRDALDRDHKFWSDYSSRLCGDWITYNTTVKQIADFVQRTYIENNYKGYIGNPRFVRDDDAQKAFSKLRSSQAGMFAWRCFPRGPGNPNGCPPEYCEKTPALQKALIRETDFAFKQAFAFCPYSPEASFRYINFLLQLAQREENSGQFKEAMHHFDDAILVAQTDQKLDPFNGQITGMIEQLKGYKRESESRHQALGRVGEMENTARTNPADVSNLITLGGVYLQMRQTNRAFALFNQAIASTNLTSQEATAVAQYFGSMANLPGFTAALKRIVELEPDAPEPRYNLASVEAVSGQTDQALADLKTALELNDKRLATNPAANDIRKFIPKDPNINRLRGLPEFQKLVGLK